VGVPQPEPKPEPALPRRGDPWAVLGFGLVVLVSVFPWSRFGPRSGPFEAWVTPWSLPAVLAALAGLSFSLATYRRSVDPWVRALVTGGLALLVWTATLLYHVLPRDPLSDVSEVTSVALVGATVVLLGAAVRTTVLLRARHSP
jgi:hypothetical protein